jgi:hypothetical protein
MRSASTPGWSSEFSSFCFVMPASGGAKFKTAAGFEPIVIEGCGFQKISPKF